MTDTDKYDHIYHEVEINGKIFKMSPLPALLALKLDKKVISLILPIFGEVKSLDQELELGDMLKVLSNSLNTMSDQDFEKFIVDMLSTTIYMKDHSPPEHITRDKINLIFQSDIITIYKLVFEIMRYNKFSPFELVGDGGKMFGTFFSDSLNMKVGQFGEK